MTVKSKKRTMTKRNVDQDGMIMIMTPTRTIIMITMIVKIIVINVGTDAGRNRDNIFVRHVRVCLFDPCVLRKIAMDW